MKRLLKQYLFSSENPLTLLRNNRGIIILMYHSIHPSIRKVDYKYSISSKDFIKHVRILKDNTNIISTKDILSNKNISKDKLNVAITFDDGYENNYSIASKKLAEYDIPFTIFLTTYFMKNRFNSFLNWNQIKKMKESMNVTFGSHSVNHWNLTMLGQDELVYELSKSKRMIEDKLNDKIDFLAYPGGGFNDNVIKIAKDVGYSAAFKDRIEKGNENNNQFHIGRISIDQSNSANDSFIGTLNRMQKFTKIKK